MKNLESKIVILVIFLGILLCSCKNKTTTQRQSTNKTTTQYQSADVDDQHISPEEQEIIDALKANIASINQMKNKIEPALENLENLLGLNSLKSASSYDPNASNN
ncbi:MAG: hypothetical protein LBD57_05540 [Endomicrobium sp.]|jgi:PBP1b-binding outer membrane lipoprotein LpoB|uniref:hypothetical protein n=1 Tax=Candidatus Endomicrobiellum cubanum TaxID=3242325 RepID=UPI00281E82B8|nr:hypothetical protein [Endomicrobium sp.]